MDVWFIDGDRSSEEINASSDGTRHMFLVNINIDGQCVISKGPGFTQRLMSLMETCEMKVGYSWAVYWYLTSVMSHAVRVETADTINGPVGREGEDGSTQGGKVEDGRGVVGTDRTQGY